MNVHFSLCADLHTDFIHDGVERMQTFLSVSKKEAVDFCVQLGDFCPPNSFGLQDREKVLRMASTAPMPMYHILGNHDMDKASKEEVCAALHAPRHGVFTHGGVCFILLDACFYEEDGQVHSYDHGNYQRASSHATLPILPPEELSFLQEALQKSPYPAVILSHQSLCHSRAGVRNHEQVHTILRTAPKGVLMAICGHEHVDRLERKDGIYYYCQNSMSYYWAGRHYRHATYDVGTVERHPHLSEVFPYRDPLFSIIQITDRAIHIKGSRSAFVGATPKELAFEKPGLIDPVTPHIEDRVLPL